MCLLHQEVTAVSQELERADAAVRGSAWLVGARPARAAAGQLRLRVGPKGRGTHRTQLVSGLMVNAMLNAAQCFAGPRCQGTVLGPLNAACSPAPLADVCRLGYWGGVRCSLSSTPVVNPSGRGSGKDNRWPLWAPSLVGTPSARSADRRIKG